METGWGAFIAPDEEEERGCVGALFLKARAGGGMGGWREEAALCFFAEGGELLLLTGPPFLILRRNHRARLFNEPW